LQDFNFSVINTQESQHRIQQHDLTQLCGLFRNLSGQFLRNILFCVIDDIGLFEGGEMMFAM
jgi:hypothetical protein